MRLTSTTLFALPPGSTQWSFLETVSLWPTSGRSRIGGRLFQAWRRSRRKISTWSEVSLQSFWIGSTRSSSIGHYHSHFLLLLLFMLMLLLIAHSQSSHDTFCKGVLYSCLYLCLYLCLCLYSCLYFKVCKLLEVNTANFHCSYIDLSDLTANNTPTMEWDEWKTNFAQNSALDRRLTSNVRFRLSSLPNIFKTARCQIKMLVVTLSNFRLVKHFVNFYLGEAMVLSLCCPPKLGAPTCYIVKQPNVLHSALLQLSDFVN